MTSPLDGVTERPRSRFRPAWALALVLAAGTAGGGAQDVRVASEAQVKAAYLHKLPAFVEWPADSFPAPGARLQIAVVDADEVHEALSQQTASRLVQGRSVDVQRGSASLGQVHVLYIGRAGQRQAAALLAQVAGRPVLTVTDFPSGLGDGAVLNLVPVDGRIRVEASLPAAAAQQLRISSRLLGVASRIVETRP
jgi:hypothetical protein